MGEVIQGGLSYELEKRLKKKIEMFSADKKISRIFLKYNRNFKKVFIEFRI